MTASEQLIFDVHRFPGKAEDCPGSYQSAEPDPNSDPDNPTAVCAWCLKEVRLIPASESQSPF